MHVRLISDRARFLEDARFWRSFNFSFDRNSVLVDDLGAADLGFKDPRLNTPSIDTLRAGGIELSQYYAVRLFRVKHSFRNLLKF